MTSKSSFARTAADCTLLALLPLALAAGTVQAATDNNGQVLTLTPNANETTMTIYWLTSLDGFSPPAPCSIKPYTLTLVVDDITVLSLNESVQKLAQGPNGRCVLQRTYAGSGFGPRAPLSPGIWAAAAKRPSSPMITEALPIYACTVLRGKQPMYSAHQPQYTDHFYTLTASERDYAVSALGYVNPDTPFAMPSPTGYHTAPFYRYFKGAPQLEHFYMQIATYETHLIDNTDRFKGLYLHF